MEVESLAGEDVEKRRTVVAMVLGEMDLGWEVLWKKQIGMEGPMLRAEQQSDG